MPLQSHATMTQETLNASARGSAFRIYKMPPCLDWLKVGNPNHYLTEIIIPQNILINQQNRISSHKVHFTKYFFKSVLEPCKPI